MCGSIRRGTAELFVDALAGRMAVGRAADLAHDLLFVAGGFTGQGYVYDLRSEDRCQRDHRWGQRAQVDGIVLEGRRLWAVQNINQVTRIRLSRHPRSGLVDKLITSDRSRCRPPRPALAAAWRWSMPSSTPASRRPPTSTRSSSSKRDWGPVQPAPRSTLAGLAVDRVETGCRAASYRANNSI